jgi:tetratricopeptide (TPR) repeat protein
MISKVFRLHLIGALLALLVGCAPRATPALHAPTIPPPVASALSLSPAAQLARGSARLASGDYAAAERDFRGLAASAQAADAALGLAEIYVTTGRYAEVASLTAPLMAREPWRLAAALWTARARGRQGDIDGAERLLVGLKDASARVELGELLLQQGQRAEAERVLMSLVEDYNNDRITESDPDGMTSVGRAAQLLGSAHDANDAFNAAERAGSVNTRTLLYRADLFLEKNDPGHAEEVLADILATNPNQPDALVALARTRLAQALDFDEAERLSQRALQVNPRLASAYMVLASIALRDEDLELAEERVRLGLQSNPKDLGLLSMRAAVRFVADDKPGFLAAKAAVFQVNPKYSELYTILSEFADWEHRYDEIIQLTREAVALDPEDGAAYGELGMNLIRVGNDREGVAALSRSFAIDPYNARVFNTLNLYEKAIAHDYVTVDHPPFRIRYRKDEREILERYVPDLLSRAWAALQKSYGFVPEVPIGVELYAERENFGVRTGGLPETAIQGVCFGHTIAAMSPKYESFNLGMTLWHELSHVFHIQLSRGRVPRWFTEGLAEYETIVARPEWVREQDPDLYQALRAGRLPQVADMTHAFTRAEELNDVATAYYASSLILGMMVQHYGMPKMTEMLRLWGEGKRTPEVVQTALGHSPAELDQEFHQYLEQRLARYATQFVPERRAGRIETAQANIARNPNDSRNHLRYALALLQVKQLDAAKAELGKALALDSANADALFLQAELEAHAVPDRAIVDLHKLIAAGHDGYATEMLLGATLGANDEAASRAAFEAAAHFDPTQAAPEYALADSYGKAGDQLDEIGALTKLAGLEQHEPKVYRRLLRLLDEKQGDPAEAVRVGEAAVYADVNGFATHLLFGRALARTGDKKRAIFELESALLCDAEPAELVEAHRALSTLYHSTGQLKKAAEHTRIAQNLEQAPASEAGP